jgi:hypothetical protein
MTDLDVPAAKRHRPRLVRSQDVQAAVHGTGPAGRFNTWLAVRITKTVGSMWIAYTFACQNVIQAANDARAEADHLTLSAVHRLTVEVHEINVAQTKILSELRGAVSQTQ